eukprot:g5829.t1
MGSSLLDPRRKRRRTRARSAGVKYATEKNRCAISLPRVAVLFGLGMVVAVGVRKRIKTSARNVAKAARIRDRSAYPLAVLLEQHDIEPQAARFADPLQWCLADSAGDDGDDGDHPTERLGLFTCVADTRFFLRAVGEALRFRSVTVVDVGDPPSHRGNDVPGAGTGLVFAARDSETTTPEMGLRQDRVKVGDPLPQAADLVLIEAQEEALSPDAWVDLLSSWTQVLSEGGVVVVRGPREKDKKERALGEVDGAWYEKTHLWEAISTVACDRGHGVSVAVGDFDRGLIVLRHAGTGQEGLEAECAGHGVEGESGVIARVLPPPHPLRFEGLFLWATEGQYTAAAQAVEAVQAKFGGAQVVRRYARRRGDRSACLRINAAGEAAASAEPVALDGDGDGHLRARRERHAIPGHHGGAMSPGDHESRQHLAAARTCLEQHLQDHAQDVRAGFALEMVLRATGGKGIDRQVARLRAKVTEESGPPGDLLWRALHARAAGAAASEYQYLV